MSRETSELGAKIGELVPSLDMSLPDTIPADIAAIPPVDLSRAGSWETLQELVIARAFQGTGYEPLFQNTAEGRELYAQPPVDSRLAEALGRNITERLVAAKAVFATRSEGPISTDFIPAYLPPSQEPQVP